MAWTLEPPKGGEKTEKPPAGNHPARLVAIVDLGDQWQEPFKNDPKSVAGFQWRGWFVWELVTKKIAGTDRNHLIACELTMSLGKKAKLRAWIGSQRGKPLGDGERFEIDGWLGHACLLNVVMNGEYPRIDGTSAVPDGLPVPAPTYPPFAWRVAEAVASKRIDLPGWVPWYYGQPVGDKIKQCQQLQGYAVEVVGSPNESPKPADQPAPQPAPAGGPPPRRGSAPAESQFYLGADGFDEKVLRKVSEIRALAESRTDVDWSKAEVCKAGGQDWTPLPVALPEFATWKVIPF